MTTYLNVLDNSTTFTTLSQELRNVVKETENRLSDKDDDRNVISTGFASLDEKVSINRNSMVILAGTPGAGKTAFALSIAMNLAEELREKNKTLGEKVKKQVVLFFSLEMASSELVERVIQNKKGISVNGRNMEFLKNKLSDLKDLEEELSNDPLPILFIDKKLTVEEIFALTVKEKDKYDVKLIIIDYIQHILPSPYLGKNAKEFEQVSHAFKKLLELKSKIKRPIIGLSQLTKESSYEQFKPMKKSKDDSEIKSNEPKRLKVADLASTSEIGKGANIILALTQYPLENSSRSLQIVKNRAGVSTESCSNFEEANIKLKFDGKKMSFTEISEESSKN
jgi:replicative DNA helicase